jgi:hypothetical protein
VNPHKRACPIQEHHANQAVGSSLLKILLNQSPAHYLHAKEHPEDPTPSMIMGSAIHSAILEPSYFIDNVVVEPKFAGTGSKALREEWHLENHGKIILKEDGFDSIKGILKSISKHKQASKLISEGHAEESLFWTDAETGIDCKARPDFKREGHILVDIKSTNDASPDAFRAQIAAYSYHLQAALYLDGASAVFGQQFDEFVIVAVEKGPPYAVNCFTLGIETINEGRAAYMKALQILKKCQDEKNYPCYDDSVIHPIGLPTWAFKQENIS